MNSMPFSPLGLAALFCALAAGCSGPAQTRDDPSWTGTSKPKAVITARLELMEHIEELMEPIDTITIQTGPVQDVAHLRQSAEVIGAMLAALPHLFPPTTNRYDPQATEPETLALPRIWTEFDRFYALAGAASAAAERMAQAQAQGDEAMRDASRALRASCDGCHALYLRKYLPPVVLESDRDFDFEAALDSR